LKAQSGKPKTWYSAIGGKQEEGLGFYNADRFSWVANVEANSAVIKQEVEQFILHHQERIQPYFNETLVSAPRKWKAFSFLFWKWPFSKNAATCPETMRVLSQIPHLVSASVSILEPNTAIHPHKGDTNAIYRCHLGLTIPAQLPDCGFQVNDEKRSWEEGKLLVFNDAAQHQAWNNTNHKRYVLLFDVVREEFAYKKYRICAFVLATLLTQLLRQRFWLIRKAHWTVRKMLIYVIATFVWPLVRIRNL
jgi:aspartyl/asparaginyl beta-hydroxylase (cupin superfamily)